MANDVDVLIAFCQEQWTQARHTEDQRATISNLIIVVASVIIGFVSKSELTFQLLPLTILLIGLGLFGVFVTEKLYELFHYHHDKAKRWQLRIDELQPNSRLSELETEAERQHNNYWKRWRQIRLHYLWLILHMAIALMGVIFTILIFVRIPNAK